MDRRPPISRTARGSTRTTTGRSPSAGPSSTATSASAIGVVHPRAKGRGLGAELVDRSEAALRTREVARIHQFTIGGDAAARGAADGARLPRRPPLLRDGDPARRLRRPLPELSASRSSARTTRARSTTRSTSAFQDHWEHHGQAVRGVVEAPQRAIRTSTSRSGSSSATATRSLRSRATRRTATAAATSARSACARPWRGKGYAKALLLHTFREFYARGMPRVTLGVDAREPDRRDAPLRARRACTSRRRTSSSRSRSREHAPREVPDVPHADRRRGRSRVRVPLVRAHVRRRARARAARVGRRRRADDRSGVAAARLSRRRRSSRRTRSTRRRSRSRRTCPCGRSCSAAAAARTSAPSRGSRRGTTGSASSGSTRTATSTRRRRRRPATSGACRCG